MKHVATAAVCAVLLPLVATVTHLFRAAIVAESIANEMQISFFASGSADSVCSQVVRRNEMYATCQGFLFSDGEKVTLRGYVIVFSSLELAELEQRDMMDKGAVEMLMAGAIGAATLNSPDGFLLKEFRRLKKHRRIDS